VLCVCFLLGHVWQLSLQEVAVLYSVIKLICRSFNMHINRMNLCSRRLY